MSTKTIKELYDELVENFYSKSEINIEPASVLDMLILSYSSMLKAAYDEIENNKTPHIYSSLSGSRLDELGILCGISREVGESDKNYLYRILKWNTSNKASNLTAIENQLINLKYSSHVTYVPYSWGCGTATAYIIPNEVTDENIELAINEVQEKLSKVVSPSTYIDYIVPEFIKVSLIVLIKTQATDMSSLKNDISTRIVEYINGIAPGDYLELGEINKIGGDISSVQYFNVKGIKINDTEIGQVSVMQEVKTKFLISKNDIEYLEVE